MTPRYRDRRDAGRQLAQQLLRLKDQAPVVLALPRGGVPVAFEVASLLHAPLDLVIVRKIGLPGHEELGIGALVDGDKPIVVMNEPMVAQLRPDPQRVEAEIASQLAEAKRRRETYLSGRAHVDLAGRTVIMIDDGIATGGTVQAALRGVRRAGPERLILAVPVAPQDSLDALATECDAIVCPYVPAWFGAVGAHYQDFGQTSDEEVMRLLDQAAMAV